METYASGSSPTNNITLCNLKHSNLCFNCSQLLKLLLVSVMLEELSLV